MKRKDKELLLKDLCARLPYGVKVYRLGNHKHHLYKPEVIDAVNYEMCVTSQGPYTDNCPFMTKYVEIEEVRPYLFPISSMTEEQIKEALSTKHKINLPSGKVIYLDSLKTFEFYDKNHIDYRGLIPLGLAMDATNKNIYIIQEDKELLSNNTKITIGTKIRSKANPDEILCIISNDCHEDKFECSNGSVLSLKQIEKYYDII